MEEILYHSDKILLNSNNQAIRAGSEVILPRLLIRPALWDFTEGEVIQTLTDESLQQNHATQPDLIRRGIFGTDPETGIKHFRLDGADDFYKLNLVRSASVFLVIKANRLGQAEPIFGNGSKDWYDGQIGWQWVSNVGSGLGNWVMPHNGSVLPSGTSAANHQAGNRVYINNSEALKMDETVKNKGWVLLYMDILTAEHPTYPTGITHIGYDSSGGPSSNGMGSPGRDGFSAHSYAHIEVYENRLPLNAALQRRTELMNEFNLN